MFLVLIIFFINYVKSFKSNVNYYIFNKDSSILNALSRNGVCVPKDVGLYGNLKAVYHCLYTRDGETKSGYEWEIHSLKNNPKVDIQDIPGKEYKRLVFGPPIDTSQMVLRDGIPYLTLSLWVPGIKAEDIKVILDYSLDSASSITKFKSLDKPISCDKLCQKQDEEYYKTASEIDLNTPETDNPIDTSELMEVFDEYDGSYNQINEKSNKFKYKCGNESKIKPPLITINCPKNTIVSQWENTVFRSNDKRKIKNRIQRSYRPFTHINLMNITCNYTDCTFQFHAPLTHIPPPPLHRKTQLLKVTTDMPLLPIERNSLEQVHGWIYNWKMFGEKYIKKILEETYQPNDQTKPEFGDELSRQELYKFKKSIREDE